MEKRGGYRPGAGRKKKKNSEKKQRIQLFFSPDTIASHGGQNALKLKIKAFVEGFKKKE